MERARRIVSLLVIFCFAVDPAWSCSYSAPLWIPHSANSSPLFKFLVGKERDSKAGYISQQGDIVIPPIHSLRPIFFSSEFHDGLLMLGPGKYLDVTGKLAVDIAVKSSGEFSEGRAAASVEVDGQTLWGLIDQTGKFVVPPRFKAMPQKFSDGRSLLIVDGKVGFIDRAGNFAIEPKFIAANPFSGGRAVVIVEGPCSIENYSHCSPPIFYPQPEHEIGSNKYSRCKYAYIDTYGTIISTERYDQALRFSEGLAAVRIGMKWGYIDLSGKMVIPPMFYEARIFSEGLAVIGEPYPISAYTGKRSWRPGEPKPPAWRYGYINTKGAVVVDPQFYSATEFREGLAVVSDNFLIRGSGNYYISKDGNRAFPDNFNDATTFSQGLAHVRLSTGPRSAWYETGTYAYIDRTGKVIFSYDPEAFLPSEQNPSLHTQ